MRRAMESKSSGTAKAFVYALAVIAALVATCAVWFSYTGYLLNTYAH